MLILKHIANEEEKEFGANTVEITKEDDGHIDSYLLAFEAFLRGCGFMEGTISKALPTLDK